MSVITQEQVRYYLGNLKFYADASGVDIYENSIAAAESAWERKTRLLLTPKTIAMLPNDDAVYDIEEPGINLHRAGSNRMPRFRLRYLPVRTITRCRYALAPNDSIIEFSSEWVKPDLRLGIVNLIPYKVASPGLAASGMTWLSMFYQGAMGGDGWPHLIAVDYTAGYDPDPLPEGTRAQWPLEEDLLQALAKDAACRVIGACRRDIPNSVTLDGFTQQFMPIDKYLESLEKEYLEFRSDYLRRERPLNMGIL